MGGGGGGTSQVVLLVKNLPTSVGHKESKFDPLVGKIPWKRAWQPTPVFFPENPMVRKGWQTTVQGVAKSQTQLSNKQFLVEEG